MQIYPSLNSKQLIFKCICLAYLHNIAGIAVADVEWTHAIQDSIKASRDLLHRYRHRCKDLKVA